MGDLPPLPDEVWADPGRHHWYYRQKKHDLCVRYVRADLYDALRAKVEAMREAFAHAPANADFAHMSAFATAYDEWWEDHVEPALAKSTGGEADG